MLPMLELHHAKAMASLPHAVYDYYAGGAGDELSVAEAESAWSAFRFRPRPLRDVGHIDTAVNLFGQSCSSPIGVAPMAFHHLAHPGAELETARGTKDAGSLFVVSTRASSRLEDIASCAGPWWFQAYVFRQRSLTAKLVERAAAAGATAIVLTGDTPMVGRKRRIGEVRLPIEDAYYLRNFAEHLAGHPSPRSAAEQSPCTTLDDIGWLHSLSGLPVLVKGVLRGDAAVECLDAGAAGVIVSNHGGRQLDRAVSTARALQEVTDAVNGRGLVLVDGGVRSGLDVLAALALGADAVLVGRPILWALAHSGGTGVYDALTALREDLEHAMALAGVQTVQDIDPSLVAHD
jgi:4-hydroxymandelate oxidase